MNSTIIRARLLPENHTVLATSVTVTPAPISGYEATNLQDPDRTKLCKVAGTTLRAVVQLSTAPWILALALTGLGYSYTAKVRIKANTSNDFTTPAFDSGDQDAWPAAMRFGEGQFGSDGFGGYLSTAIAKYWRPVKVIYFDTIQAYAWWEITITDTAGTGYVSLGILGLCEMIEFERNFSNGWKFISIDTTVLKRTTGGQQKIAVPGTRYVRAETEFASYPGAQKWDIHRRLETLGSATPCFFAMHPKDAKNEAWTTLYGNLTYSGLTDHGADKNSFSVKFEEQPSPIG